MSAPNTLPKRSTTSALLGKQEPLHPQPQPPQEEPKKKSKNPFKFLKSHSHHQHNDLKPPQRARAHTVSKEDVSSPNPPIVQPLKRSQTALKPHPNPNTSLMKKLDTSHLSNPFAKSSTADSVYSYIGVGSDIAAPRNSINHQNNGNGSPVQHAQPGSGPISRAPSFKDNKMVYNPYGINSRTPSQYSITSVSDDEKKNILPLPIMDPNQEMPDEFKQEYTNLTDEFVVPEKGSVKDRKLGDGASATVILVQNKKTSKSFALKKFCLLPHEQPDQFYKRAMKEFVIAKRLSHNKHIAQTYFLVKIQTTTNITRGWGFILEYCKGGDLFGLISRTGWRNHPISEKYCIFKQVVLGLRFMHSKGIVHRDLKPENVLVAENGVVKLTDFGVAEYGLENPDDLESGIRFSSSFVGSPPYVSPEVMNLKLPNNHETKYDPFKLDLWALGMILFCLAYQGTPFRTASPNDTQYREYLVAYSTYLSANPSFKNGDKNHGPGSEFKYAKEFQSNGAARVAWRLCDPDHTTRYSIQDVFEDPWFISVELCCDEVDSDYDNPVPSTPDRVGSFDSNYHNSRSNTEHITSKPLSTKPSPISKPKSMLDLLDGPPLNHNIQHSDTIKETDGGSENGITNGTSAISINDQTGSLSSQVLPPLQEADNESLSTSPTNEVDFKIHSLDFSTARDNLSDAFEPITENYEDAIESPTLSRPSTSTLPPISTTNLQQRTNSTSSIGVSPLTASTLAPITVSTTLGPHQSSPKSTTTLQPSNNITPASISHNIQRASSFSSLFSNRSTRSMSGSSLGLGKKKKVHHHLDISNVQNHGTIKKK